MRSLDSMSSRIAAILATIEEKKHPAPVIDLPFVFLTSDGLDWPGCEESNARAYATAAALGIAVDAYAGIGPDEEGIEP